MKRRFIREFQFWIALATVLESLLTFWLFLLHWFTWPVRVVRKIKESVNGNTKDN